jgi:hypothetical protein
MKEFLGIMCGHCRVYFRIYKHASGKHYEGRCPKCGRYAKAIIDPKRGLRKRFFIIK